MEKLTLIRKVGTEELSNPTLKYLIEFLEEVHSDQEEEDESTPSPKFHCKFAEFIDQSKNMVVLRLNCIYQCKGFTTERVLTEHRLEKEAFDKMSEGDQMNAFLNGVLLDLLSKALTDLLIIPVSEMEGAYSTLLFGGEFKKNVD